MAAAPATSPPAVTLPSLPLPKELTSLLARHASLQLQLQQHADLLSRLASLLQARAMNHNQMEIPVDLGRGFMIEGVVRDTSKVFVLGLDDIWIELEVDKSEDFVRRKMDILERKAAALEEPIEKLKADYALVTKTLRTALELPDDPEPVTPRS